MTLLELVQNFCRRAGLTVPQIVMTSGDDQSLQIAALFDTVSEDLVETRRLWSTLQREVVFQSVAGENQGKLSDLAPGYLNVGNQTLFDRTQRLAIPGPVSAQDWQAFKTYNFQGPLSRYRIIGGELHVIPGLPAGHTLAFEYTTRNHVTDGANPAITKSYFTKDSDYSALPDHLLLLGVRWMWKAEKGLRYADDFRLYESAVTQAMAADGTTPALSMGEGFNDKMPGIVVPSGNWNV